MLTRALSALADRIYSKVPLIPTLWRRYDRLPKNANGKIDREALRQALKKVDGERAQAS